MLDEKPTISLEETETKVLKLGFTPKEEEPPQVELKPLPLSLRYGFLGPKNTYPIIVNSNLNNLETEKLLKDLKSFREAIGYTIDDIKGISPSICLHRIFLENNYKPSKKILNPNMKKVVRKEILKLLDASIIFPISNSEWVSYVHVVPMKGGTIIIMNKNNELIPTRTVTG